MTSSQIKKLAKEAKKNTATAAEAYRESGRVLERIQNSCPHKHTESWTNDDGYGSFKVEKCLDCGLQKDGGLT